MPDRKPNDGVYRAPHRSLAAKELRRARRAVEQDESRPRVVVQARRLTVRSY